MKNVRTYKRPRSAPGTNLGVRNKNRATEKVTRQQRASAENKAHYQSGREWAVIQSDGAVTKRRQMIAKAIPPADFVPGIIRKGSIFDV